MAALVGLTIGIVVMSAAHASVAAEESACRETACNHGATSASGGLSLLARRSIVKNVSDQSAEHFRELFQLDDKKAEKPKFKVKTKIRAKQRKKNSSGALANSVL
jgi:hypothetical protein